MSESETNPLPQVGSADTAPLAPGTHQPTGEQAGAMIGAYRLLEILGEGGFGTVWLAERREPFVQRVALKVIKAGMDSKTVIARFEAERQALALMHHPGIAKVFDAGATPVTSTSGGRPYFVMEHVKGMPITEYCDRHRLTVEQRLRLFGMVCEAVQHAHTKGIIHRDLKPSNVLVTVAEGGEPRPVVIDFGVAKALAGRLTDRTIHTEHGVLIGTPEYMSPEQAEMSETDIDTRTDVYALGVVLYELLAGAVPFDPKTLRAAGYAAIQRIIREEEPPKPSTRLSALGRNGENVAQARRLPLEELASQLRRELELIPLKALRKDRAERYRSASELGDDIGNYLSHRPLIAAPDTFWYLTRKLLVRNRHTAVTALLVGAVALVAAGTAIWIAERARRAETDRLLSRYYDEIRPWILESSRVDAEVQRRIVLALSIDADVPHDPVAFLNDPRSVEILEVLRERVPELRGERKPNITRLLEADGRWSESGKAIPAIPTGFMKGSPELSMRWSPDGDLSPNEAAIAKRMVAAIESGQFSSELKRICENYKAKEDPDGYLLSLMDHAMDALILQVRDSGLADLVRRANELPPSLITALAQDSSIHLATELSADVSSKERHPESLAKLARDIRIAELTAFEDLAAPIDLSVGFSCAIVHSAMGSVDLRHVAAKAGACDLQSLTTIELSALRRAFRASLGKPFLAGFRLDLSGLFFLVAVLPWIVMAVACLIAAAWVWRLQRR